MILFLWILSVIDRRHVGLVAVRKITYIGCGMNEDEQKLNRFFQFLIRITTAYYISFHRVNSSSDKQQLLPTINCSLCLTWLFWFCSLSQLLLTLQVISRCEVWISCFLTSRIGISLRRRTVRFIPN